MAKNLKISLLLHLKDFASKVFSQVKEKVNKSTKEIEQQTLKSAKKSQEALQKTAQVTEQSQKKAGELAKSTSQAREVLGIRSERAIQREIINTQRAYQRLKQSGVASSRELARAFDAQKRKVAELNREMGKVNAGQRLGNVARGVASIGAGLTVGATMVARPIKNTADYQRQLAYLANTAYADRDITGRQQGMDNIHAAIKDSLKYGGSKETVMEALSEIVSKGKVSVDDALKLLPTIQKNALATGASSLDIAQLVNAGLNYGIKPEQIQDLIDYANASGKAGGFELRDMAQYAPQIFSAAKGAGIDGMNGAKEIFKYLQQVYNVSGGSAETATNISNFLKKLNSQDTINRAEKIDYVDPKDGKKKGIDLVGSMKNYMASGQNTVEAFLSIVDQVLANDKEYQKLKQAVDKAKDSSEKKAALERIAGYVEGSKIGELVADQQAWLGLFGIRSQIQTAKNIDEGYLTAKGGTAKDGELILNQAATKFEIASNVAEMSKYEAFKSTTDFTGDIAKKLTDYASVYPELTNTLVGATESIKILGSSAFAAAGSLAILDILKGGKGVGGLGKIFSRTTTVGTAASAGNALSKGGNLVSKGKNLINVPMLAITGLSLAADNAANYAATEEEKKEERAEAESAFYKAMYKNTASKNDYWRGYPIPKTDPKQKAEQEKINSAMVLAYGGKDLQFDNEVAKARLARGTLTQEQYEKRLETNQQHLNHWRNEAMGQNIQEIQQLGQQISEGVNQALQNQPKVIENHIRVDLDGRVIAEQVSEYQYYELVRG